MADAVLTVDHVEVTTDGDLGTQFGGRVDVDVTYTVRNTGDTELHPRASVRVASQIGGGTRSPTRALRALTPGESVTVHERIDHVLPFGSVDAIVTVRSDAPTATASASTPVVPWLLLALLAAVIVAFVVRRVRRSRVSRSRAGGQPPGRSPRSPAA
jgi:hypothetical protein